MTSNYQLQFEKAKASIPPIFNLKQEDWSANYPKKYQFWWKIVFELHLSHKVNRFINNIEKMILFIEPFYPNSDYAVFPENEKIRGFPHQDSETGKLCLWPDRVIGYREDRLWQIIRSTKYWIEKAATSELSLGETYDLPDFSCREYKYENKPKILFSESAESYLIWKDYFHKFGICNLIKDKYNDSILFVKSFEHDDLLILDFKWGDYVHDIINHKAIWVLLEEEPVEMRKKPFRRWSDLYSFLIDKNIVIQKRDNIIDPKYYYEKSYYIILIGFPIPYKYGEELEEIHWQPVVIPAQRTQDRNRTGFREGRSRLIRQLDVEWGESLNIHYNRYFGRGKLISDITNMHIGLIGLGALGSYLATILVSEGIKKMDIFEGEDLKPGNLCRHSGDMECIWKEKIFGAIAGLEKKNPFIELDGHNITLPILQDNDSWEALLNCDIWIDCTASKKVENWISEIGKMYLKQIIRVYITVKSKYLCIYGNGQSFTLKETHQKIMGLKNNTDCNIPEDFFKPISQDDMLIVGAGCWHPTFPAKLHDILALLSLAIDRLDERLKLCSNEAWAVIIGFDGNRDFGKKPNIKIFFEGEIN